MACFVCGNELPEGSGRCLKCNVSVGSAADPRVALPRDWSAAYVMSFLFFPVALILWAVLYAQDSPESCKAAGNCLVYGFLGSVISIVAFALCITYT